jgi:hypothetical protein
MRANPLLTSNEQLVKITAGMHPECLTGGRWRGRWRRRWPSGCLYFTFDFRNYVTQNHAINVTTSFLQHNTIPLNNIQANIQVCYTGYWNWQRKTCVHIPMFFALFFKIPCNSHQAISVADFGLRVNHVKHFISLWLQNLFFLNFDLERWGGGGGCIPWSPWMCTWITAYTRQGSRNTMDIEHTEHRWTT